MTEGRREEDADEGEGRRLAKGTASLLRGLATLSAAIRDFEESDMKTSVYNVITGLVVNVPQFRAFVDELEFLSSPLCIFPVQSGVFAYTVECRQMNIHFVVPATIDETHALLDQLAYKIQAPLFRNMSINLRPLLEGGARALYRDVEMEVVKVLSDRREISAFVPLSKMYHYSIVDADRLFWTSTLCGKIVVVRNPPIPFVHGKCFPVASDADLSACASGSSSPFCLFARALRPSFVAEVVECLLDDQIPKYSKSVVCRLAIERFGLVDDIVTTVGSLVQNEKVGLTEVNLDMFQIYKIMTVCKTDGFNKDFVASSLLKVLQKTNHPALWSEWVLRSRFVYFVVDNFRRDTIARLCSGFAGFAEALMYSLCVRVGDWSRHDVENSHVFLSMSEAVQKRATDPASCLEKTEQIRREADRLFRASADFEEEDWAADRRYEKAAVSVAKKKGDSRRRGKTRDEDSRPRAGRQATSKRREGEEDRGRGAEEEVASNENHNEFVERNIRQKWPQFGWRLIGSGVFTDTGDVDVVATVPQERADGSEGRGTTTPLSFDEAVARVASTTGFSPVAANGGSDGKKLVVLVGEIDGKHVDVQVVRALFSEQQRDDGNQERAVRKRTVTTTVTKTTERSSSSRSSAHRRTAVHSRVKTTTSTTTETEETFEVKTVSEGITASAVSLARGIEAQTDGNALLKAKILHSWFTACGMKGNKICNLPGVAVTCIAIMIACRNSDARGGVFFLLRMAREVLVREGIFDFDEMVRFVDSEDEGRRGSRRCPDSPSIPRRPAGRVEEGRPGFALRVVVNEKNVASRITAAWTRHLLDTVAFALSLEEEEALSRAAYERWRRGTMARAAILVEKDAGAMVQSLHPALVLLDSSPLVDTYHVQEFVAEGGNGSGVEVLCSICPFAPARYSFGSLAPRPSSADEVATERERGKYSLAPLEEAARSVIVSSGGGTRSWPLLVSDGETTEVSPREREKCATWIKVGAGKRVPNTPTLTVDVVRYFDASRWEPVV